MPPCTFGGLKDTNGGTLFTLVYFSLRLELLLLWGNELVCIAPSFKSQLLKIGRLARSDRNKIFTRVSFYVYENSLVFSHV